MGETVLQMIFIILEFFYFHFDEAVSSKNSSFQ